MLDCDTKITATRNALANQVLFSTSRATSVTSTDRVCQLRWTNKDQPKNYCYSVGSEGDRGKGGHCEVDSGRNLNFNEFFSKDTRARLARI